MKRIISAALALLTALPAFCFSAAAAEKKPAGFDLAKNIYAHAAGDPGDGEAWVSCSATKGTGYFFLPSSADKKKVELYNALGAEVKIGSLAIPAGKTASFSYETGKTYAVTYKKKSFKAKFMRSNAEAAVFVNNSDADGSGTELISYLNEDKSRTATATGAVTTPDGKLISTPIKKIKGRGNTTWLKPKKAYNITYSDKVSIAGMSASKKYSILANYQDDSLSRNRILYDLSDAVGMPYASDSRYVDFYSNGVYLGSYQMAEKIDTGKDSLIPDFSEDDYLDADGSVKEDFPFLCEVDAGAKDGEDYYVKLSGGLKITIKSPELAPGDKGYEEVKKYVRDKFSAFYNAAATRTNDLSKYADADSLAGIYLINELGKNWDSGVSSLYFTYKPDEKGVYKFYGSPVWDYDNSLGNAVGIESDLKSIGVNDYEEPEGWWCMYKGKNRNTKSTSNIIGRLALNLPLADNIKKLWFEKFIPAIDHFRMVKTDSKIGAELFTRNQYYSLIADSAAMNYASGWKLKTSDWVADHTRLNKSYYDSASKTYKVARYATAYPSDFKGAYNYACDWLISRAGWLSKQLGDDIKTEEYGTVLKKPSSMALSKTTYVYDGKAKKPKVKVKGSDGKVIGSKNYTLSYSKGRKDVGAYSVTVTMKGSYTGKYKLGFRIVPPATSIKSATKKTLHYRKSAQATGYELRYSAKKSMKKAKTLDSKKPRFRLRKLKPKKYYIQARAYTKIGKTKYYSAWSGIARIKIFK